jgi:nucleoside-diphosphate-sugar epimerase
MATFLVFGHRGWIGSMMLALLEGRKIPYIRAQARAHETERAENEITRAEVTHVLCLIGRTHGTTADGTFYSTIDYLETNVRDNMFAPLWLAHACLKHRKHLTYLGTGCIFEYNDDHPFGEETRGFVETDPPNFAGSSYSIVKGYTDLMMQRLAVLNLRIRMPIIGHDHPRNFITKIATYDKICSVPNSMSVLDELLPKALDLALGCRTGTVNFTNPGVISHDEILHMYKELVDPDFTWKNFTIEDQSAILASGRSNNCLDTTLLTSLCPEIDDIRTAVRKVLTGYKKENAR